MMIYNRTSSEVHSTSAVTSVSICSCEKLPSLKPSLNCVTIATKPLLCWLDSLTHCSQQMDVLQTICPVDAPADTVILIVHNFTVYSVHTVSNITVTSPHWCLSWPVVPLITCGQCSVQIWVWCSKLCENKSWCSHFCGINISFMTLIAKWQHKLQFFCLFFLLHNWMCTVMTHIIDCAHLFFFFARH